MSEKKKSFRLFKVAKEFNVGSSTLVDYLHSHGYPDVQDNPNAKLDLDMYEVLLKEFASDQKLKEKADQIKELREEAKAEKEKPKSEAPEVNPVVPLTPAELKEELLEEAEDDKPDAKEEQQPKEEPKKEAKKGLKVVGKVDLDKDKKPKKKEEPKAEEQPEEQPKEEPKKEEKAPAKKEEPVAEKEEEAEDEEKLVKAKERSPKLEGLKIKGKIDLPVEKKRGRTNDRTNDRNKGGDDDDTRKRKRKRKTTAVVSPVDNRGGGGKRTGRKEPDKREVSDNLRDALAKLGGGKSRRRQKARREKRDNMAAKREALEQQRLEHENVLEVTEFLTANELASLMDVNVNEVIAKCMELGLMVSINQRIDSEVIELIASEFGYRVEFLSTEEAITFDIEEDDPEDLQERPPIITVMGHVDHGKTSLLDYIRKANVIAGEAGGITQHIGAYNVELKDNRKITFLDTPGHEAFTAMRARGAQLTDVAIIVIAADDQVMPQTKEAINHAQAANVPMVIAINKIDKPGAQPDKIREQLSGMDILVEDWGGKVQCQEISAKKGENIDELLEKVLLEAEILELKANPDRNAYGAVVEAQLDKGRGVVATMLVQGGTLSVGDMLLCNQYYGRVKAMTDERGNKVEKAGPSMPVQILGLDGVPTAGDKFQVMSDEREARELAIKRQQLLREQSIRMQKHVTLEEVARRSAMGDSFQELNIIVKGDVDGSVEALADSLLKLSTEEVVVNIIMKGVGQISENDVLLASASNALVIGFQVRPSAPARRLAEQEGIDVRLYSIIYKAIEEIRDAMEGLLKPKVEEEVMGAAEVREVFKISKVGTVAGCYVIDGKVNRAHPVRLIRDGVVVYSGVIDALKRFKDDVKEVAQGFECGISIVNFNDIKVGDVIEAYTEVEVKRTLAEAQQ